MENWIKKWTMTEWGKTAYNTLQIYDVKIVSVWSRRRKGKS